VQRLIIRRGRRAFGKRGPPRVGSETHDDLVTLNIRRELTRRRCRIYSCWRSSRYRMTDSRLAGWPIVF